MKTGNILKLERLTPHLAGCAALVSALGFLAMPGTASAAGFTISGSSSTAQTLSSGTGAINANSGIYLNDSSIAITVTGNSTIVNSGTIYQSGTLSGQNGRAIRDNTASTGVTVTNNVGAVMMTADADVIQLNKASNTGTFNNYGSLISNNASAGGNQAIDFNAITGGVNVVNNFSTGYIFANEADAVRPGVNGVVNNSGTIKSQTSTGSSSDGIDAQNNSGVTIFNDTTGVIEGGRHGITGGASGTSVSFIMTGTNNGIIKGDNGSGMNIDGFNALEVVTFVNHGTITGSGATGDGDGVDVDGLVNLTNTGVIKSLNSVGSGTSPEHSEGVTVGGGTIINSGTIEGDVTAGNTTAVGRGITIAGVDKDVNGNPIPIQPIYGNTTITNSGLIKGQSDSGIAIQGGTSGFTVTINNNVGGLIIGGGTSAAAIQTSDDNTNITNSGTIDGSSSGKAIVFGSGSNTLTVSGTTSAIIGNVIGGAGSNTLIVDVGAGNSFNYSGTISNFSNTQFKSGSITMSGSSALSGTTSVSSKFVINGFLSNSPVVVKNGGTLAGSGTISSSVRINSGGTTFPGASGSPAKLTVDLNYDGGSNGRFSITGSRHADNPRKVTAGTDYDQIVVTGSSNPVLTIGSNGVSGSTIQGSGTSNSNVDLTLDLGSNAAAVLASLSANSGGYVIGGSNTNATNYFVYLLGSGTSTGYFSTLTLTDSNNDKLTATIYYAGANDRMDGVANVGDVLLTGTLGGTLVNLELAVSYTGNYANNSTTGGHDIVVTAVPEPGTYAMMAAGFCLLVVLQRFRARKAA